jgi:hypothetical protein
MSRTAENPRVLGNYSKPEQNEQYPVNSFTGFRKNFVALAANSLAVKLDFCE